MNSTARIFADITATLEDMHIIAVEGQHPDLSGGGRVLIVGLRSGVVRLDRLMVRAERIIGAAER